MAQETLQQQQAEADLAVDQLQTQVENRETLISDLQVYSFITLL